MVIFGTASMIFPPVHILFSEYSVRLCVRFGKERDQYNLRSTFRIRGPMLFHKLCASCAPLLLTALQIMIQIIASHGEVTLAFCFVPAGNILPNITCC
jgi:hypothetical protein